MNNKLSVFGSTGFVGNRYCELHPNDVIQIDRNDINPKSQNVLYLISTTDNYNVFTDPVVDIETNLVKLMQVLNQCRDNDVTFNFISSWFVYGSRNDTMHEDDECNPKGFYSITKRTAEQLLIEFCIVHKIKYRILRLPNVVGQGDSKASPKKNVLQNTINLLKNNQPITIYDQGTFTRDYMHIDDVCRAIDTVIKQGSVNEIFNIGTGISTRFIDVINAAKNQLNSTSEYIFVECPKKYKSFQLLNCRLDVTKLTNLNRPVSLTTLFTGFLILSPMGYKLKFDTGFLQVIQIQRFLKDLSLPVCVSTSLYASLILLSGVNLNSSGLHMPIQFMLL